MQTTFHFNTASEISPDLINTLKTKFSSKSVTIIIDNVDEVELTDDEKQILDERLNENTDTYLTAEKSLENLKQKYGL